MAPLGGGVGATLVVRAFVSGIVIVRTCLHEGSLYLRRLRVSSRWRLSAAAHAKSSSPADTGVAGRFRQPSAAGLMEGYRYVLLVSGVWTAPFSVQSMVTIAVPGMCAGVVAFQVPSEAMTWDPSSSAGRMLLKHISGVVGVAGVILVSPAAGLGAFGNGLWVGAAAFYAVEDDCVRS